MIGIAVGIIVLSLCLQLCLIRGSNGFDRDYEVGEAIRRLMRKSQI